MHPILDTTACCSLLVALAPAQDHLVPAFDHGAVPAAYVVTLPAGYTDQRPWPLILDFHGAIAPAQKGAEVTRDRLWSKARDQVPAIVVGINGRTRSWGTIKGEHDDVAFAKAVLAEVCAAHAVDATRIYLAGFSSGSDFLCRGLLQQTGLFAASMPTCPGPPNVVGLKDGALLAAKDRPFYFVTGEEDYIRKDGPWQAFLALDAAGARVMYREVPNVAHAFFPPAEYAQLFAYLELLAGPQDKVDHLGIARAATARGDYLLASTHLLREGGSEAKAMLADIEQRGRALEAEARALDADKEPGRAYEAWWRVRTQFHRFPALAQAAEARLDELRRLDGRTLGRARGAWFKGRRGAAPGQDEPPAPVPRRAEAVAPPPAPGPLWTFDRYLSYDDLTAHLRDLAARFPERVRLSSIGKSIEGRDLWVVELCDRATGAPETKPAAFVQACLHGNEVSALETALYFAWQCAANPDRRRGTDRLLRDTVVYVLPAANPDAVQRFLTAPYSYWRPRFNLRPFDSDGDGAVDEDGAEDLDGDGEIGLMYRPDAAGPYVLQDGRLARRAPGAGGGPRYALVGREGLDDDGDGNYGEDPPGGVDLNRNFPVGFGSRKTFEGSSGESALSEPESAAIAAFVLAHPQIGLFFDYHNDGRCVFYWHGPDDGADVALLRDAAARADKALGYPPRELTHAGAGLAIAWAYGALGIPAWIVELESCRGDDEERYLQTAWGDAFQVPHPFRHPQLGDILLGNDWKKLQKRNPAPADIVWQAARNWDHARTEMAALPHLELRDLRVVPGEHGIRVQGRIANRGRMPTDTARAQRLGRAQPIRISAEGASIRGEVEFATLAPGAAVDFALELVEVQDSATLVVQHPRAGTVRYKVARPRHATVAVRTDYRVEPGYATPDRAVLADNGFYRHGVAAEERGPAFRLAHRPGPLRLAVLLGEWRDQRHAQPPAAFARALFSSREYTGASPTGQQVYGSLADFYREMSYGKTTVTGEVFGWYELPGSYADYRDASFGSSIVQDRLVDAVREAQGEHALDGFDGIAFVWAGNAVARTSALWPMRLSLPQFEGRAAFKTGELHQGEFLPVGVPCHELAHTFGVNDKYGLGASANPFGPYCLLARGTHGAEPSARHRPFPLCAWCRMVIGWVQPAVIDPAVPQRLALRPTLSGAGECYRVLLQPDGSEYLLLENRRREGFCTDLPGAGLFVLHVGPDDKPDAPQKRTELLPAHGLRARAGDPVHPEAVPWPQPGHDALTVGNARLSHIRLVDDVVYLEVGPADR